MMTYLLIKDKEKNIRLNLIALLMSLAIDIVMTTRTYLIIDFLINW
jgi:hypothetical protein